MAWVTGDVLTLDATMDGLEFPIRERCLRKTCFLPIRLCSRIFSRSAALPLLRWAAGGQHSWPSAIYLTNKVEPTAPYLPLELPAAGLLPLLAFSTRHPHQYASPLHCKSTLQDGISHHHHGHFLRPRRGERLARPPPRLNGVGRFLPPFPPLSLPPPALPCNVPSCTTMDLLPRPRVFHTRLLPKSCAVII